jgi:5-methylcytosine-specific restriction endonuclease McrA
VKSRKPLRRKAPLSRRPPTRSKHTPGKVRRRPAPDQEFWRHQREALFARSDGRCEIGGCFLSDTGLEAHHRKLRSQGGGHGLENLLALCPRHHREAHAGPDAAVAAGWIVPREGRPVNRPVTLWTGRTVRLCTDGTYDLVFDAEEDAS